LGPSTTAARTDGLSLSDLNARSGRVTGVAYGAPGPRVDLDKVLESWRNGDTVGGSAQAERPAPPPATPPATPPALAPDRTVALTDGTTISFSVARAVQTAG